MPFIQDELNQAIEKTASSSSDWCVTLESKRDAENWIQLTSEFVNLHYPMEEHPSEALAQIGWPDGNLDLETWEAGTFVTFAHKAGESVPQTAEFVCRYIESVLQETSIPEDWTMSEQTI